MNKVATSITSEEFLALLDRSKLVRPDRAEDIVRKLGLDPSVSSTQLASSLVARNIITNYQASRLLSGRYRGYFYNHYKIIDILGAGGMGWVYLAQDMNSQDQVVLKVLSSHLADDAGMMARLKLESRAGQQLFHPRVARTIDEGQAAGSHFLVMEYVHGISLRELVMQQGPVAWPVACHIVKQIADGLHYAHERGLVHRDIKPENFLVNEKAEVKILDFGLALIKGAEEEEFSLSMIFGHDGVGTLDYMAPEQSEDSHHVDRRADIYGLGGTFYSILTGLLPYAVKATTEKIEAHRSRPFPLVRSKFPNVPPGIDHIIAKMTAKDPKDRYQTAAEVAEALAPLAKLEPIDFDYESILRMRREDAQRRMLRTARRARGESGTSSIGRPPSQTSPILKSTQGNMLLDTEKSLRDEQTGQNRNGQSFAERGIGDARPVARYGRLYNTDGAQNIPLHRSELLIGRSPKADIHLDSSMISSTHCRMIFNGQFWKVTDLESRNGIRVNGVETRSSILKPGDRLTIAEVFQYEIDYTSEWAKKQRERAGKSKKGIYLLAGLLIMTACAALLWWWLS
ncbi:Serine/threonine-protein kinase StkP [Polystyrenella longa]|uniref:Serine/threonine-protein kinase StkP n=1 Tax=Polystyrenella longa TaxID=2528007 RepID=A0A518CSB4_9PLAN|nr:FHA domain-containing serine/threonine-protein kinase [Polystyrenella longa]QDU82105.1 Serine/threonine-protein kinase StkP [Polystyrenella longa]